MAEAIALEAQRADRGEVGVAVCQSAGTQIGQVAASDNAVTGAERWALVADALTVSLKLDSPAGLVSPSPWLGK
jgi:hypothetical protein